MSKNHCNHASSCCNNNYCNTGASGIDNSLTYMLAILLLFAGGGSQPGSFWGNYNNMFLCSGFNNGWCSNNGSNNNFNGNNLSNTNFTGFLNNLSDNNNIDINKVTDSYI